MPTHDEHSPETPIDGITPVTRAERHALEAMEELELGGRRFSKKLIVLQALGGVFGVGVLAAAIYFATSEENAEGLRKLQQAPTHLIAMLGLLSFGTIATWGVLFTVTVKPLHTIPYMRTIAVNAIATFVAAVPFKLSIALRGLIHHKGDGVPIKDCLAWFAALSGLTILTMLGLAGIALYTQSANALFYSLALIWIVTAHLVSLVVSRWTERRAIQAESQDTMNAARWMRRVSLGVTRIHQHPRQLLVTGVLRVVEIAITALRFTVAAQMVGVILPVPDAMILALTFSVISILAPTGTLGLREGGTTLVATAGGLTPETAALIALVVSVAELATAFAFAIPATLWIKPWNLLSNRPPESQRAHSA